MVGLTGPALLDDEKEILLHPCIGGVILFSRNYVSPRQLEALTTQIHGLREPHLLIAVDHEGGRVQRFRDGFTLLPPMARLGALFDGNPNDAVHHAEQLGWLMAAELRALGVDFSFAPVVDVDHGVSRVIGDRAIHHDPGVVGRLALGYVRGMQQAGMAATAKHFPGHGGIEEDTHEETAVDRRPYEAILKGDLQPFKHLIHHGVTAVMAAHVIYKAVDAQPAGFSRFWLQTVLREDFGFQGVIFSDDVYMAGAHDAGNIPDRTQAALEAGCDMVLLCEPATHEETVKALDGIKPGNDPVSHLRLVRMHGRQHKSLGQLHEDPQWQQAVNVVQTLDGQQSLDLS
jgi:beta-N-acetylhexosaminidase